jgi:hypothetical protein
MTTRTTHASYALDLDGLIYVEDVTCEFSVVITVSHLEPFSWGQSRGTEIDIDATLTAVKLGDWKASREIAVQIFGEEAIGRAENVAQDRVAE